MKLTTGSRNMTGKTIRVVPNIRFDLEGAKVQNTDEFRMPYIPNELHGNGFPYYIVTNNEVDRLLWKILHMYKCL